jgi:preprotein translocase subunit SecA
LVEYDDVLAKQRQIVYEDRNRILRGEDVRDIMMGLVHDEIADLVDANCPSVHSDDWDTLTLYNSVGSIFRLPPEIRPDSMTDLGQDELADALIEASDEAYAERERALGEEVVRAWERRVLLVTLSGLWIHHVDAMDELREAALLQAFGQQDPLVVYKRQAFDMFGQFQVMFRKNVVYQIYHVLFQPTAALILEQARIAGDDAGTNGKAVSSGNGARANGRRPEATAREAAGHARRNKARPRVPAGTAKLGRNDPCYCGSGKKFKHCHGR